MGKNLQSRVLVVTERGRYVWYPLLQYIGYIDKGSRNDRRQVFLTENQNTYSGGMRAIARDILKTEPPNA